VKLIFEYADGHTLSYADYGATTGHPILVQHGMIASIGDYHLFDRLIWAGRRVICLARPGYGASSPYPMHDMAGWGEIVALLVDDLGLARFDVLGISSGAPYGYAIGYALPDRVRDIFIFSGTPALYDDVILAHWPYPVDRSAGMPELEEIARAVFFADLTEADLARDDIRDSMAHGCFGVAQDLRLRCMDWGFALSELRQTVYMQHSRVDAQVPFVTAEMTAKLIPHCRLAARESGPHFSEEVLDDFVRDVVLRRQRDDANADR
jgi:pimeloyl-ACP methyl ester carboxylesterase